MLKTQNFEAPVAAPPGSTPPALPTPNFPAPPTDLPHPSHHPSMSSSLSQATPSLVASAFSSECPQSPDPKLPHSSPPSHLTHSFIPVLHPSSPPLPLSALAAILGCTRSTIRHFADRLGFRFTVRHIGARHKRAACLTPEQAEVIAAEVERDSAAPPSSSSSSSPSPSADPSTRDDGLFEKPRAKNQEPRTSAPAEGLFYLLQLEPEHDPGRFKLGFSADLESRLDDLLTVVPLAKLIATWPARRSWERIAIISTAQHAVPISQEVFRIERLEEAIAAADRFFAVMPELHPPPIHLEPWVAHASRVPQLGVPPSCRPGTPAPATPPTPVPCIHEQPCPAGPASRIGSSPPLRKGSINPILPIFPTAPGESPPPPRSESSPWPSTASPESPP